MRVEIKTNSVQLKLEFGLGLNFAIMFLMGLMKVSILELTKCVLMEKLKFITIFIELRIRIKTRM